MLFRGDSNVLERFWLYTKRKGKTRKGTQGSSKVKAFSQIIFFLRAARMSEALETLPVQTFGKGSNLGARQSVCDSWLDINDSVLMKQTGTRWFQEQMTIKWLQKTEQRSATKPRESKPIADDTTRWDFWKSNYSRSFCPCHLAFVTDWVNPKKENRKNPLLFECSLSERHKEWFGIKAFQRRWGLGVWRHGSFYSVNGSCSSNWDVNMDRRSVSKSR